MLLKVLASKVQKYRFRDTMLVLQKQLQAIKRFISYKITRKREKTLPFKEVLTCKLNTSSIRKT